MTTKEHEALAIMGRSRLALSRRGMALEPLLVTGDSGPNPESADMVAPLLGGPVLTVLVFCVRCARSIISFRVV